ncbi:hypothetical protein, partial [Pseudomonas savastanoi]|uniref:hypothetical protein n=1 Tax=Pseudomonas savastanoi TaxID=29438 RepID=UPI001C7FDF8E
RDLPGTGSKTSRIGLSGAAEAAYSGAASQPIADKSAPIKAGRSRTKEASSGPLKGLGQESYDHFPPIYPQG